MASIEWGAAFRWYLTIQAFSLPCIWLSRSLFPDLPDRGYAGAKFLGVLLLAFGGWLAYAWLQFPFTAWLPWVAWLMAAGAVAVGRHQHRRRLYIAGSVPRTGSPWGAYAWIEALFLAVYLAWIWVVSHDPAIAHTEQPMDFMFMNSLWHTRHFPPQDAWLAGYPVSYYYLGYWMFAWLGKASQVPPAWAYNIGQASWYAFLWLGAFGIGYNAYALWQREASPRAANAGQATGAGCATGMCVAGMGNLQGLFEWLHAQGLFSAAWSQRLLVQGFPDMAARTRQWFISDQNWWWFRSARVLADRDPGGRHLEVIDEFPLFSYLLGDNHPHVLAAPILFAGLTCLLQWLGRPAETRPTGLRTAHGHDGLLRRVILSPGPVLLAVVLCACAFFANAWDAVALICVMSLGLAGALGAEPRRMSMAVTAVLAPGLALGAALLLWPQLLTFQSQIQGVRLNMINPTRWPQLLNMWGPLFAGSILAIGLAARQGYFAWSRFLRTWALACGAPAALVAGAAVSGLGFPGGPFADVPLGDWQSLAWARWRQGLVSFVGLSALLSLVGSQLAGWRQRQAQGRPRDTAWGFLLSCATLGLGLIFVAEVAFLEDRFGPLMRMNTVFKFYYQAWSLLAVVLGVALAIACAGLSHSRGRRRFGLALLMAPALLSLGAGLAYPVAGLGAKVRPSDQPLTVDALSFVRRTAPGEAQAIEWIQQHALPSDVILEGPGRSYHAAESRLSGFTGRPTLLGWIGHERQWRGEAYARMAAGREEAAAVVYQRGTEADVAAALAQWNIRFVYVGPVERQAYGVDETRLAVLARVLTPVWEADGVLILERRA